VHRLDPATAPELRAVVRFVRDAGGSESLGIGYAALYLRAAPAGSDTSEILAAIGTMAARMARRASARRADGRDGAGALLGSASASVSVSAAQIEVAESYGVHFRSIDATVVGGRARLCYDGEAWEQVLASPSAPPLERARAALFLAGGECLEPGLSVAARRAWNDHRIEALGAVEPALLPAYLAGRLRLRRAEALAWRGFDEARRAGAPSGSAAQAEAAAVRELALTDRGVLAPEDLDTYDDVAVRVAASRFATETPSRAASQRRTAVVVVARGPGESCVRVVESGAGTATGTSAGAGAAAGSRVVGERCTYGVVWQGALRWSSAGNAATIAVQPLPAWTELWVIRRVEGRSSPAAAGGDPGARWTIEPLVPATTEPQVGYEVGYVEAAGFSPDGARLLVVREARASGQTQRRFQVLSLSTLTVENQAGAVDRLLAFKRWSAGSWRAATLALR
jgi:hypothetical protein